MAIIQGNAKQGSTRGFYPKVINGSLRFNDDDSAYLSWTPASAGNRKTWTISGWVKKCQTGQFVTLLQANHPSSPWFVCGFDNGDKLEFTATAGASASWVSTSVYRDPSAWYHLVFAVDTTSATTTMNGSSTDRIRAYVNGEQVVLTGGSVPSQNSDLQVSNTVSHTLGGYNLAGKFCDQYLANVHFIDGQALTASDFGETKNGVWVAKDYAGTYGTNGFYLTFEDDTEVEAFNTVLWRGNSEKLSVSGVGFKPDLVWIKERTSTSQHGLIDSVRGANKTLFSDATTEEFSYTGEVAWITSFDNDGFTVGADNNGSNELNQNYVAWCWKAGDSNVSNTDGTITSTVRANDTYGFSICSFTTPASGSFNFGHGLSSAPNFIISKSRTGAYNWPVYHSSVGAGNYLLLNTTDASAASTTVWGNTTPSTSVVYSDAAGLVGNQDYIAYCWSETTGYSKFGSYTGGTTSNKITTGFKPALIIVKNTTNAFGWWMVDNTRDVDGTLEEFLFANASDAEGTSGSNRISVQSDGFTLLDTGNPTNASGSTYIYAAFADTREAAFWLDQSGNDNDWQPVNLDHNDTVADSPTDNFATLNPLKVGTTYKPTFSDGNLRYEAENATQNPACATLALSSGSFYFEGTLENVGYVAGIGVCDPSSNFGTGDNWRTYQQGVILFNNGTLYVDGTSSSSGYTFSEGDVIGIACDVDSGKVFIHKNGTYFNSGDPVAGTGAVGTTTNYTELTGMVDGTEVTTKDTWVLNFGQQPFKYDPPA